MTPKWIKIVFDSKYGLLCFVVLISPIFYFLIHLLGLALNLLPHQEIAYHQCGDQTPIRAEIPAAPKNQTFSCDIIIKDDGYYMVALQYSYTNHESAMALSEMLGGPKLIRTVNGKAVSEPPNDGPREISYSFYKEGVKVKSEDNIFPKLVSHTFGDSGGYETKLIMMDMMKGQKYSISVSGIPEKFRTYGGVYLVVRERIIK